MKLLNELINEIVGTGTGIGKDLSKLIGKSPGYVSQIRSGEAIPSEEILAKIAFKFAPDRLPELFIALCAKNIQSQQFKEKNLEQMASKAVGELFAKVMSKARMFRPKETGRNFNDFPEAFKPL